MEKYAQKLPKVIQSSALTSSNSKVFGRSKRSEICRQKILYEESLYLLSLQLPRRGELISPKIQAVREVNIK